MKVKVQKASKIKSSQLGCFFFAYLHSVIFLIQYIMKKRKLAATFAGLLLLKAALVGCGQTDDVAPSSFGDENISWRNARNTMITVCHDHGCHPDEIDTKIAYQRDNFISMRDSMISARGISRGLFGYAIPEEDRDVIRDTVIANHIASHENPEVEPEQ